MNVTEVMAVASDVLLQGGYKRAEAELRGWSESSFRVFEDPYNVVGVAVFETPAQLLRGWADLQGGLVEVISRHVGQGEGKAWDGYLVLLTPGLGASDDLDQIRYNTIRLRKIVATGDYIKSATDVERVLRPLLPLASGALDMSRSTALDLVPELLEQSGIRSDLGRALIEAFREQASLVERLHEVRGRSQ